MTEWKREIFERALKVEQFWGNAQGRRGSFAVVFTAGLSTSPYLNAFLKDCSSLSLFLSLRKKKQKAVYLSSLFRSSLPSSCVFDKSGSG